MSPRRTLVAVAAIAVMAVLSDVAWRERSLRKFFEERQRTETVDMGIALHVVVADPQGIEYVHGKPPLRILRTHRRGAVLSVDGDGEYRWSARSSSPMHWYCSVDAEPLILHDDTLPNNLLIYGSEGAGKTDTQAKWCYLRALARISQGYRGEIGMTAPTSERAQFVKIAIERNWSANWYRWNERNQTFTLPTGLTIKLRSTKRQSAATGSPIQGYNWSDAGSDEIQDSIEEDDSIESRLRDAPSGYPAKRCATATSKDDPEFRTWRDRQLTAVVSGKAVWHKALMLASNSPFIDPAFLTRKRSTMSMREYDRRYRAVDLGPERQVYHTWSRNVEVDGRQVPGNLRMIPDVGAVGVTARELSRFGRGLTLLAGHDPGRRQDVTLFLRAYEFANVRMPDGKIDNRPRWFVIDELTTEGETHEAHVKRVVEIARDRHRCGGVDRHGNVDESAGRLLARLDPHTRSGDEHPGQDVYRIWRSHKIATYAAAYAPATSNPLSIKPETRIELLNTLFCDALGVRRLFVLCDARGVPAAPRLVDALETMERDEVNRAEWERKDGRDKSHWPAALAYALYAIEAPRLQAVAA